MKLKVLSQKFYDTYSHCTEILKKKNRPYACMTIELDGLLFAVPFRHHIKHKYAFHTIGEAGLDYTKAVINQYKRAMKHRDNPRSENILKYSTLKYFEKYL